jgi:hypothetical protein
MSSSRGENFALRIKGKGSVFQDIPVPGRLSQALLEWKGVQETFKGRRILAPGGINFAASQFRAPFSNWAFNLRLRAACSTDCGTARLRFASTKWEKILVKNTK